VEEHGREDRQHHEPDEGRLMPPIAPVKIVEDLRRLEGDRPPLRQVSHQAPHHHHASHRGDEGRIPVFSVTSLLAAPIISRRGGVPAKATHTGRPAVKSSAIT
jgi:hypothetical protein